MDTIVDPKEKVENDNKNSDNFGDIFVSHMHSCVDDTSSGKIDVLETSLNLTNDKITVPNQEDALSLSKTDEPNQKKDDNLSQSDEPNQKEDDDSNLNQTDEPNQKEDDNSNLNQTDSSNISAEETSNLSQINDSNTPVNKEDIPKSSDEKTSTLNQNDKEINVLFDKLSEFIKTKNDFKEDTGDIDTIPTGIDVLDCVLGGGFAMGKLNCLVGRTGCGKTMLAIQTIANAQKLKKNPLILYLDSEESVSKYRLYTLGVRNPTIKPYTSLTVEKVFKLIEALCVFKENENIKDPSFIVWDSIANTLSEKEMIADDPNSVIGYRSRLFSILIPKYVQKCSSHNITIIAINQLRDKIQIGPYGAPADLKFLSHDKVMPGGNVLQFNIFHLLEMKSKSIIKEEQYGFSGVSCEIKAVKNKLFPPNIPVVIAGNFVTGFDNFCTNYMFLASNKFLQTGAWNYLKSYPTKKFRTKDARSIYESDLSFKQAFDEAVKEALKVVIKDPFGI